MPKAVHEDTRRTITDYSFPDGVKSVKFLVAHKKCVVGNHFHKLKDEFFVLMEGSARAVIADQEFDMVIGDVITCRSYVPHTFHLTEGSRMTGFATELFDETDEYPL